VVFGNRFFAPRDACDVPSAASPREGQGVVRGRYEITYTSLSISLRLLMPFRNVSAQLIPDNGLVAGDLTGIGSPQNLGDLVFDADVDL
jgi:hypothetical protein